MKYVIIKKIIEKGKVQTGCVIAYPILFPDALCHCHMVPKGYEAISAGFCNITTHGRVTVDTNIKSESLKLGPLIWDADFIAQWLVYGDSLSAISSAVYEEEEKETV